MNSVFGENGFVYRIINKLVDLLVLNVVYILTCIPIFTIGAANTALYCVTLKMSKNEEGYIVKQYWKALKSNFKKSTIIWLFFLMIFIVLGLDFNLISGDYFEMKEIMFAITCAVFILVMIPFSYIAPQIAVFENTVNNYLKNAVIISMTRIGYTIPIVCLNFIPFILLFLGGEWLEVGSRVMIMIGCSAIAYMNSFLFHKVFLRYM